MTRRKTHGLAEHPLYKVWHNMIRRCYNPKCGSYRNYGARGITVCDRWRWSVTNFVEDMGSSHELGLSIDRINNDGNYEPENCRWATTSEQQRNREYDLGSSGIRGVSFNKGKKKWQAYIHIDGKQKNLGSFSLKEEAALRIKEMGNLEHLNWGKYFLQMAESVSSRSSCGRRQVGSVIVKDKMIISTGYNGTPRGVTNCKDGGCRRFAEDGNWPLDKSNCCHAELNAIVQAARCGIKIEGATLYCTHSPCRMCATMIINAGIKSVVYKELYPDSEGALDMMRAAGVWVMIHEG